jgi:hypothetical protein
VIPEMLFFIGDVRDPSGIAENSDKVTAEILATMHALRRVVFPKPGDGFLKFSIPEDKSKEEISEIERKYMKQFHDLRDYAMEEVSFITLCYWLFQIQLRSSNFRPMIKKNKCLSSSLICLPAGLFLKVQLKNPHVLQAMLVVLAIKHISKIQVWNDQVQNATSAFESVSDFRFILFALRNEDKLARFLPSYRSLSVRRAQLHCCDRQTFVACGHLSSISLFSFFFCPRVKQGFSSSRRSKQTSFLGSSGSSRTCPLPWSPFETLGWSARSLTENKSLTFASSARYSNPCHLNLTFEPEIILMHVLLRR